MAIFIAKHLLLAIACNLLSMISCTETDLYEPDSANCLKRLAKKATTGEGYCQLGSFM
jgi:hypothetical protein